MKKSAHAYSALIQNTQFRACIARKECGHFNEVGRKSTLRYDGVKAAIQRRLWSRRSRLEVVPQTALAFGSGGCGNRCWLARPTSQPSSSVGFFLRVSHITFFQQIHKNSSFWVSVMYVRKNYYYVKKECGKLKVCENSIFRYKRPKRVVGALQVWKCSMNPRPRSTGRGRGWVKCTLHKKNCSSNFTSKLVNNSSFLFKKSLISTIFLFIVLLELTNINCSYFY